MVNEPWQEDWATFADLLEEHLQSGRSEEELSLRLGGKTVKWQGLLKEKNVDDDISPAVTVVSPKREISFGSLSMTVDILSIPIAEESKHTWREAEVGSTVEFTARLRGEGDLLPPIFVLDIGEGKAAIMIGLTEGRLLECDHSNST